jgi:hypothetical protein
MTKYGSLIPALSDHHAGGTNVGRTIINDTRLGGETVRDQYFLGSQFARDLRLLAPGDYRDLYGTYGPRSFAYAEMVFGNAGTIHDIQTNTAQRRIYAYRTPRALTLVQLKARTGVPAAELQIYNPALVTQVPAGAAVYLPKAAAGLGADVAFWHRDAPATYLAVLADFLRLEVPVGRWDEAAFLPVLGGFASRFRATGVEEGAVMATVLAYVVRDIRGSGRGAILTDFRTSPSIATLFSGAVSTRESMGSAPRAADR